MAITIKDLLSVGKGHVPLRPGQLKPLTQHINKTAAKEGFERLATITECMYLWSIKQWQLDDFSVSLDFNVDISSVHMPTKDMRILAETQVGDIKYQLTGVEEEDDCITLSMIIDNMSLERVEKSWSDSAVIDGFEWPISAESAYFDIAENSWKVENVKVYKVSPSDESRYNRYNKAPFALHFRFHQETSSRLTCAEYSNQGLVLLRHRW